VVPRWDFRQCLGFYMALIGGFAAFIILLGTTSRFGPRVSKILGLVAATALFVFGLYQLWRGVSAFVD